MANNSLQDRVHDMRDSLIAENVVGGQFFELEHYERDEERPGLLQNIMNHYFHDAITLVNFVHEELRQQNPDCAKMETLLHQLRGASASVGAKKVTGAANRLLNYVKSRDTSKWDSTFKQLREDQLEFQGKIRPYVEVLTQWYIAELEESSEDSDEESEDEDGRE